jgi:formylglycine-generating enzyme required for sulfatase activity
VYDDGSRAASLTAPGDVRVETEPEGAALVLSRYRDPGDGRLVESDAAPLAPGIVAALEPGSYLVIATLSGHLPTRYPFTVERGERRSVHVTLPRVESVPEGMIYVPAGRFLYGSSNNEAMRDFLAHQPMRAVELPAFLVARTETTYAEYIAFLRASSESERKEHTPGYVSFDATGQAMLTLGGHKRVEGEALCAPPRPCVDWLRLPVGSINRHNAAAYAAWLARSGRLHGARLCTDREWERAARGADDRLFPWGDADIQPDDACWLGTFTGDASRAAPCEPGTHPAARSPFGVDDVTGNVWEWTAGTPDAQASMATNRGGGYLDEGFVLALPNRTITSPKFRSVFNGMRVCADWPAPPTEARDRASGESP